jgi:hypothetical protein
MSEHLWPLLRLKADSEKELIEKYRQVFIENYVRSADEKEIEIFDWHGNRVKFHEKMFEHAFSESSDYRFGGGVHDKPFSKKRARCILWIKEVLAASKGSVDRLHQIRYDSRGRPKKRRTLVVIEESYVVVLEETRKKGEMRFITAFPADAQYLAKIRRESSYMETKKSPSLNGD